MGRDKAWLPWRGQPMIAHVVSILRPIVDEVVVVASDALAPFQPSIALLDWDVVAEPFSISLNGRGLACSAAIPVGPGERICVLDTAVEC